MVGFTAKARPNEDSYNVSAMRREYRYATEARVNDDGVGRRRVSRKETYVCDLHCLLARGEFVVEVVVD